MIIKIIVVAVKCCWRLVADCQPAKQPNNLWRRRGPAFVADCCFDLLAWWSSIAWRCCCCYGGCERRVQLVKQHALWKKEQLRNCNTVVAFPATRQAAAAALVASKLGQFYSYCTFLFYFLVLLQCADNFSPRKQLKHLTVYCRIW